MRSIITTLLFALGSLFVYAQEYPISSGTITDCGAFLVDSGYSANDYTANENETVTICSDGTEASDLVNLYWTVFNLGTGDQMSIYDGPDNTAPLIGTYTGTDLQGVDITATTVGGCLTVEFISDGDASVGNFGAAISCGEPCEKPWAAVTVSEADPVQICVGEEFTIDGSTTTFGDGRTVDTFEWDFGDGTTNTADWPEVTHSFDEEGAYTIQLTVTDDNGCANANLIDQLIYVSTTPEFELTASADGECLGTEVDITATVTPQTWTSLPQADFGTAMWVPDNQAGCFEHDLTFTDFIQGATITDENQIENLFINFEHTFMGDLVITFICPNGQSIVTHQQGGGGTDLGDPVSGTDGTPGVGYDYYWAPDATNGTWAQNSGGSLASGTYESVQPFSNLVGCPLNGTWEVEICDMWGADDGYIFDWAINVDPSLYATVITYTPEISADCDGGTWSGDGVDIAADCQSATVSGTAAGANTYTFTVTDNFGCSYEETLDVNFITGGACNAVPDAEDDAFNITENLAGSGDVSENDSDPEGQDLTFSIESDPSNGAVVMNADGEFTYTPDADFYGSDSFTYEVCDTAGGCSQATVILTVQVDSDGDLIADVNDLDDDNDGILDYDECQTTDFYWTTAPSPSGNQATGTINGIGYTYVSENPILTTTSVYAHGVFPAEFGVPNQNPTIRNDFAGENTITFDAPVEDPILAFSSVGNPSTPVEISFSSPISVLFEQDVALDSPTQVTGTEGYLIVRLNGTYEEITFDYLSDETYCNFVFGASISAPCDSDEDGIEDKLDLDSDNDGIYDAVEAGHGADIVDGTVSGDVGLDGIPDGVQNEGEEDGDTTNYTLADSDGDGNSNAVEVDSDNDGCYDSQEAGFTDGDDDGMLGSAAVSVDANGVVTSGTDGYTDPGTSFTNSAVGYCLSEICDDDIDNDDDGATDCEDSDCESSPACNIPPTVNDDDVSVNEDESIDIDVLANDNDPDGTLQNPTIIDDPENGTVTVNPDGTITYTPDPEYSGEDSFTYETCDSGTPTMCGEATVDIEVINVNDSPAVIDDAYTVYEDTEDNALDVLANDSDPDGDIDVASLSIVTQPENGTATTDNGVILFTPDADFEGSDSFTYAVCDDASPAPQLCEEATVSLTIKGINDAIEAKDDDVGTDEDVAFYISVLNNDVDIDGSPDFATLTVTSDPENGTAQVVNGGQILYTPNENYNGTDSFTYSICDDGSPAPGLCDDATVNIFINAVNDEPTTAEDVATCLMDESVSANVTDNDTDLETSVDSSSLTIVGGPYAGSAEVTADGEITYTPNPGYLGGDAITYQVCDLGEPMPAACATGTLIITVQDLRPNPEVDVASTEEDEAIIIDLVANDTDPNDDLDPSSMTILSINGEATYSNNGDGTIVFTPNPGTSGTVTMTYQVCDETGLCAESAVAITVGAVNDGVQALNDMNNTFQGQAISGNVLTNDVDPDGHTIVLNTTLTQEPFFGSVELNEDGSYTYTPFDNFSGQDKFKYQICDDADPSMCDEATVNIAVILSTHTENDPPVANADSYCVASGTVLHGNLLSNDFDPEEDALYAITTPLVQPLHGSVTVNFDGTFIYTPQPTFQGLDAFTYQVCEGGGDDCSAGLVYIEVVQNDPITDNAPMAVDDAFMGLESETITGNILQNDWDPENQFLFLQEDLLTQPTLGEVEIDMVGNFSYTPFTTEGAGSDQFSYRICDYAGNCANGTVYLTTIAVNDFPVIELVNETEEENGIFDGSFSVFEDQELDLCVLLGDVDGDGAVLNTNASLAGNGIITDGVSDTDTCFKYIPTPNFNGMDQITITWCDAYGACDEGIIEVAVIPVNDAPIGEDDLATTTDTESVVVPVLTNDTDVDEDELEITSISGVENGEIVFNDDGTLTYIPDLGFCGVEEFTYTVCDNGVPQLCDEVTVQIEVTLSDADEDGIPDALEGITTDTDEDGTPDFMDTDSDNDGVPDAVEGNAYNEDLCTVVVTDTDMDGIPDYQDEDSDNDGMDDETEAGDDPENPVDTDDDGTPDFQDEDSDNDGIDDEVESGDGNDPVDTDDDGTPDYQDEDSDNDGIDDTDEAGDDPDNPVDTDNDGDPDFQDTDSDDDGIDDEEEGDVDTDNDGTPDFQDEDSDDDGITDEEEGNTDTDNDGDPDYTDTDSDDDGIDDEIEAGDDPGNPTDSDDDGIPDYQDDDSDNDGIPDEEEAGNPDDPIDSDNDGNPDYQDIDSDNDGNLDSEESEWDDCDNDGIADIHDSDTCHDSVIIPEAFSPNGDGIADTWVIEGLEFFYPNASVNIFNRWGAEVYKNAPYTNDWNGDGNTSGAGALPTGTYYYVIDPNDGVTKPMQGFVYINRQ